MSLLNLITAFIPIYNNRKLSSPNLWAILAMLVVGVLCVLSSAILYTQLPTEVSGMLACVAPILLAFMLAQTLFEKKEKTD